MKQFFYRLLDIAKRSLKFIRFLGFILIEIVVANLRVAYHVIFPGAEIKPGVVAIKIDLKTPNAITWLVNVISLTPGTLVLEISDDNKMIFVHDMFLYDVNEIKKVIKSKFEKPIMEILE